MDGHGQYYVGWDESGMSRGVTVLPEEAARLTPADNSWSKLDLTNRVILLALNNLTRR